MLCVVCTVHKEMRSACFLVWPQNQGRQFLPVWPQNWWLWIFRFGPQNWQLRFGDLGLKITATVSWFGPQNKVGYSLLVVPQNQREDEDGVGYTSRSSDLLHVEASRARVSQSGLKTGGGATWMVHVASLQRSCGVEAKDGWIDVMGCIRLFYPNFAIFIVLGPRGILVF
jgi:hypothetical protein